LGNDVGPKPVIMIEAPRITEQQQKELRYEFIKMIEEYPEQDQLEGFRREWDGAVHFQIMDDHTTVANIAGEEKLPADLKEKTRQMLRRFNDDND
jgi:hypothetical protein